MTTEREYPDSSSPLIHIPLYCDHLASDHAIRYMVELHLACLDSYFSYENTYDVLVTTNDLRSLEVLTTYKEKSGHRFELRLVTRKDLLSAFGTDESRLRDIPCIRTIFSKFYPMMIRECDAIVHVDYDTLFVSKVDLSPLLVSGIGLVDANQFHGDGRLWNPTRQQAEFFAIGPAAQPVSSWINTGVFAVQREGFELCRAEISHYLENLERAIAVGLNELTDEMIMNALAVREPDVVKVIPDYRYNFLAYFLTHDPSWTWSGQIVHFHSLKPDVFFYRNGAIEVRCEPSQSERLNQDFYLAALIWFKHLYSATTQLAYEFPVLEAIPLEVVEKELTLLAADRHFDSAPHERQRCSSPS
ncbi:MAG TPA: hypothetical protein VGO56_06940 [Pyrinomonadaceae bacterium]|jgi:hypothetical protein|nr:hypothetical protein [Pyrinomonadaceae bacterium]